MVYSTLKTPGVYLRETTRGGIPVGLAPHDNVYMLVYSATATAGMFKEVVSSTDFFNTFGASASSNSVKLYFAQKHGKSLQCLNVPVRTVISLDIPTVVVGNAYTLTIAGYAITHTAVTGDTEATILAALADKVNTNLGTIAKLSGTNLRVNQGTIVTQTGITLGTPATPSYPDVNDIVEALDLLPQRLDAGFLICPEFYQQLDTMGDRQALANSIEGFCAQPRRLWVHIVDCGEEVAKGTAAGGAVQSALTERSGLQSPHGHAAYYFPYWVDLSDNEVPMSAAVAGVALRRYAAEGFIEPPAGTEFPVYGVKSLTFDVQDIHQDLLNVAQVNCARVFPNGLGRCIYGARTLSTSPYFKYVSQRVVLNVIGRTLQDAYRQFILSTVDGNGVLFSRIRITAVGVCERIRVAGGLFGATPDEAYLVVCDLTNNSPDDLANGIVNVTVAVKLSPVLEFLIVNVVSTALGDTFVEVVTNTDPDTAEQEGESED